MINFASLFNQFRSNSNNSINDMLDQQDVSLTRLLDDESFANQYKAGNTKLTDYLKYNKIKELVDYITVVGPQDDKRRSHKFPLLSSDILSSDNNTTIDFFFPQGKLYEQNKYYEDHQIEVEQQVSDDNEQTKQISAEKRVQPQVAQQPQKTIIKDTLDNSSQEQNRQKEQTNQNEQQEKQKTELKQPVKRTIKVKKIQKLQKISKTQVQPLITYLFQYFTGQINYILTGYVCKVLTAFFNKKSNQMMEFLFVDNNVETIVNHIESRSVGQFLVKVMTYQSDKFTTERADFFKKLLEKLAENNGIHVLSNFSTCISETIEKAALNVKGTTPVNEFSKIFFTPEIVTLVIKNVMSDHENVCVYNAPILLTYLTNVPFTLPQDENIINQFKELLKLFIQKSLQKLNINNTTRPKLGFGRIKIIEILTYILKEDLLGSRNIFASFDNAFPILFNLCQNYQMNNVLHNQVVKIINIALTDTNEDLSKSFFANDVLLNFVTQEAAEDQKIRAGDGFQKFRKGYIGHIVQICRLIQEHAEKSNKIAQKIQEREEFQLVLSTLVQRQVYESNKSLAGFSMKKDIKHQIMFQKQDIITHYFDFLSHSPKPVFEAEPQPINIQHPDFLQQISRQIEENLHVQQTEKPATKFNDADESNQQVFEPKHLVKAFKVHLDYDLQSLLEDL